MAKTNDKRQAARNKVAQMRKTQQKREKRNRILLITGIIVFLGVLVAAVVSILSQEEPTLDDVTAPSTAIAEKQGIPVGSDLAAGTVNEGAPVLDIYFDVSCSFCDQFEEINAGDLEQLAASGDVTLVYHPLAVLDQSGTSLSGYSGRTAQALAVIADQSPEYFIPFMQAAFDHLHRESEGQMPSMDMESMAEEVGVPADVANSLDSGEFKDWILAKQSMFTADGFTGTPTILLNGENFAGGWQQPGALASAILAAREDSDEVPVEEEASEGEVPTEESTGLVIEEED